jgi:hypothetical protein
VLVTAPATVFAFCSFLMIIYSVLQGARLVSGMNERERERRSHQCCPYSFHLQR